MKTNLDRFMELKNSMDDMNMDKMSRNGQGEIVVFNTSLLEEFSVKSEQQQQHCDKKSSSNTDNDDNYSKEMQNTDKNESSIQSDKKVHVPINDWKSSHQKQQLTRNYSSSNEDDVPNLQNSSFEIDDEEELDEELEKLRIDQERSFKAKLHTFEILAKQEEEAARRAAEANLKRQQHRAKLAAERSKSLSNINSQPKHVSTASNSVSSSSLQNKISKGNNDSSSITKQDKNKPIQNVNKPVNINNNNEDQYYCKNQPTNSVVYNFKEKLELPNTTATIDRPQSSSSSSPTTTTTIVMKSSQSNQAMKINEQPVINNKTVTNDSIERSQLEQSPMNNIYENVPSIASNQHHAQFIHSSSSSHVHQSQTIPSNEIIADPDAIRNASQKLLQQQQQIYQNQPPLQTTTITTTSIKHPSMVAPYPNDHYSNITSLHGNFCSSYISAFLIDNKIQMKSGKTGSYHHAISDDVGLPPIQITKSIQTTMPTTSSDDHHQHPVYQNQIITNTQAFHNYENSPETMMLPARDDLVSFYPPPEPNFHTQPQPPNYPLNPTHPYFGSNGNAPMIKNAAVLKQSTMSNNATRLPPTNRYGANGYNPNHWVIQEAELRQSTQRMQQQQSQPPPLPPPSSSSSQISNIVSTNKNCPGYLSVSGKKKCSKCGDELGKGCAAMVVESLSLYYHINCFRCSVCNIQLGNGTVGTDVRVRNNKLHCQNCYSNDEGMIF
ncbi:LIM and calponin-like proteiny domains-containing protein 1-like [Euroglyphus maynei]|uniref:LIM and calponin-like proteiny domains-containing protein 1-like n=1 Tax=Euroglyphus maynei TaxID=6958 RepID=A0A1Y3BU42_EURMA|nr:LIM and calponin-like proteiny domains-containing protein 1-like [Euroglyphus maynei]